MFIGVFIFSCKLRLSVHPEKKKKQANITKQNIAVLRNAFILIFTFYYIPDNGLVFY